MAPERLPEIQGMLISHLRRPTPRPTGKTLRRDMTQPFLADPMRVNKVTLPLPPSARADEKVICDYDEPVLYSTVSTDHLLLLRSALSGGKGHISSSAAGIYEAALDLSLVQAGARCNLTAAPPFASIQHDERPSRTTASPPFVSPLVDLFQLDRHSSTPLAGF